MKERALRTARAMPSGCACIKRPWISRWGVCHQFHLHTVAAVCSGLGTNRGSARPGNGHWTCFACWAISVHAKDNMTMGMLEGRSIFSPTAGTLQTPFNRQNW